MKNKKIGLVLVTVCLLSLTGCTKYVKKDKQVVKNELTGQSLTENILCRPTDEDIIKLYDDNRVNISKLPSCDNMGIASKNYDGLWTTIFVQPLGWLIVQIVKLFKSIGLTAGVGAGLALIISTLLIRGIMYPFTKKSAMQSENLKKIQPELNKLEKKYANKTDQESMMAKSQEMMILYKKNDINPLSGCLFAFIQIPLFFAFLEAINRVPVLFEGNFLGFKLGMSPAVALFNHGNLLYIILIALVIGTTYYSFKLNSGASMSKEQEEQMKTMKYVMMGTMIIASFTISTGIAFYWITSSAFTIFQNLIVKRSVK